MNYFYLAPLPLIRRNNNNRPIPNLEPSQQAISNENFFVDTFVNERHKIPALIFSTLSDRTYAIHDNMKVIGYVVMGNYFDYRKIYG